MCVQLSPDLSQVTSLPHSGRKGKPEPAAEGLRRKLRSNAGASLSIALLLFLVCSILGVVVLTAASAAAGRMAVGSASGGQSSLADMDQRYYSVTSAARLLAKELGGKKVKIEETRTANSSIPLEDAKKEITVGIDDKDKDAACKDFLEKLAGTWYGENSLSGKSFSLAVSDSDEESGLDSLSVEGTYSMTTDGSLTLDIQNSGEGAENYLLTLTFTPTIKEWAESSWQDDDSVQWTKHTDIQWELTGIRGRENGGQNG